MPPVMATLCAWAVVTQQMQVIAVIAAIKARGNKDMVLCSVIKKRSL
jgi:hypothetical protein